MASTLRKQLQTAAVITRPSLNRQVDHYPQTPGLHTLTAHIYLGSVKQVCVL